MNDTIELALRANNGGGLERRQELCRCDSSVGMSPCEYCAIDSALRQADKWWTENADLRKGLDVLDDVIQQACWDGTDGQIDSMACSAYADGIRLLAQHGRLVIDSDRGRRVIAHRVPAEQKGQTLM